MSDPRRIRLEEQLDQALTDLRDLETQVATGEIDLEVAARFRGRYETAAADALESLDHLQPAAPTGRSRRRIFIGVGASVLTAAVVTVTLISALEPRRAGGFVTGGLASSALETQPVDLSTVSNDEMEQVVAANPEVFPMRLALARRYLEDGDFSAALPHYMFVLERETNPEALMYVGWMTYVSGEAVTGVALLRQSLDILPDQPLAQWFLANALFHGTGDTAEAVPLLRAVIESGLAPEDIVSEAQRMLDEATQ